MSNETTKEAPPKEVKKEEPKAGPLPRAKVANVARALLKKFADLDTVKPSFSTMPHISSGSVVLNNLLGGSKAADGKGSVCPGFPRRRITEIYGPESCGKTTLALSAVVQCQKAGGLAVFVDFEHALHDGYARQIGVSYDEDKFLLVKPDNFEQGMKAVYLMTKIGVDLIVVDSVAAMVPKDEMEKNIDDPERVGSLAAPLTRNLKKMVIWLATLPDPKVHKNHPGTAILFINQTRAKIATGGYGGDEEQTPGGKALKFFSSIRLKMVRIKTEVIKKKLPNGKTSNIPYGNVTSVKLVKTKIDLKQGQEGVIFIRYGHGLDDVYSVIENGVRYKIIKLEGAYYQFGTHRVQGREGFRTYLLGNVPVLTDLQGKVAEAIASSGMDVSAQESLSEDDQLQAEIAAELGDDAILGSDAETEVEQEVQEG